MSERMTDERLSEIEFQRTHRMDGAEDMPMPVGMFDELLQALKAERDYFESEDYYTSSKHLFEVIARLKARIAELEAPLKENTE
jgi:hypothetical protein